MRNHILRLLVAVCCACAATVHAAKITLNSPPEVPASLNAQEFKDLTAKRNDLLIQFGEAQEKIDSQARDCHEVEANSPKVGECRAKALEVRGVVKNYRAALDRFNADRVIKSMNALAKHLKWSAEEQARLAKALSSLASDGDQNVTGSQVSRAWQNVLARGQGEDFAREASHGEGPGFPGAGTQSFEDCAIFALANASGQPYGVTAARAAKLIGEGEWRDTAERADPQKIIEQQGLNGGEVVMLAEAFGQAEVVPGSAFSKTLKDGRPVLVNVTPASGDFDSGHEVVLTKTFQHDGETWYEMMDSNQGAQRRLYLSATELTTMQKENGVAFRPEPGTVPKLFR